MDILYIINILLKVSIVTESFMLASYIAGLYFLLTSDIKNGLQKALSSVFVTGAIYSLTILVSLFLLSSDYDNVQEYPLFKILALMFFAGRVLILFSRLYLSHQLRNATVVQKDHE